MKKSLFPSSTQPEQVLTPFEEVLEAHKKNAHYIGLLVETQLLLEGLEKAQHADPAMLPTLNKLADEAIVALAQEMALVHGVSA